MDDLTLLLFILFAILMVVMTITILKIIEKIVQLEKKMKFLIKAYKEKEQLNK